MDLTGGAENSHKSKSSVEGSPADVNPRLHGSQSGGLFLAVVSKACSGQQMVFEREWGAIYSKQIFYPWQVMESATAVWQFNKSAQATLWQDKT